MKMCDEREKKNEERHRKGDSLGPSEESGVIIVENHEPTKKVRARVRNGRLFEMRGDKERGKRTEADGTRRKCI